MRPVAAGCEEVVGDLFPRDDGGLHAVVIGAGGVVVHHLGEVSSRMQDTAGVFA